MNSLITSSLLTYCYVLNTGIKPLTGIDSGYRQLQIPTGFAGNDSIMQAYYYTSHQNNFSTGTVAEESHKPMPYDMHIYVDLLKKGHTIQLQLKQCIITQYHLTSTK